MIISHKFRFIFIKTQKTAGTSLETYLSSFCDARDILTPFGREELGHSARNYQGYFNVLRELAYFPKTEWRQSIDEFLQRRKFFNHIGANKIRCRVPKDIWNGYYKFCIDRNPWDKTISHYYFMTKRKKMDITLDEYLNAGCLCFNYGKYTDYNDSGKIVVDRVIRYENLNVELSEVLDRLGIPFSGSLEVRAKADIRKDRRPYQEVLTDSQREREFKKSLQEKSSYSGMNFR